MSVNFIQGNKQQSDYSAIEMYVLTTDTTRLMDAPDNGRLGIIDWVMYESVNDESGEKRTILSMLNEDGIVYSTVSETAIKQFLTIKGLFADAGTPINAQYPLKLIKQTGTSRAGRAFVKLVLDAVGMSQS